MRGPLAWGGPFLPGLSLSGDICLLLCTLFVPTVPNWGKREDFGSSTRFP